MKKILKNCEQSLLTQKKIHNRSQTLFIACFTPAAVETQQKWAVFKAGRAIQRPGAELRISFRL